MRRPLSAALAAASFLAFAAAAHAAWIPDGTPLWPGHTTPSHPGITADAAGGFFVSLAAPSETTFFRFEADGSPAAGWPWLRPGDLSSAYLTPLAPDGAGGGYFAASKDFFDLAFGVRVYRLRADGSHDPAFGAGGVALDSGTGRRLAMIGPDGDGGALVTWNKSPDWSLPKELWGCRVTAAGLIAPGWPPGGAFIAGALDSEYLAIGVPVPDGAGGFFQYVEGTVFGPYGQVRHPRLLHYDGIGQTIAGWPAEGLAPPGLSTNDGFGYLPDGGGGVYLSWRGSNRPRLLHLTSSGGAWAGWPTEGLEPCPDPTLACYAAGMLADGEGGIWFGLQRQLLSPADPLYLNLLRFAAGGGPPPGWAPGGVLLPAASATGMDVSMAHGPGGACVLLHGPYASDATYGFYVTALHAARVEADGALFDLGNWSAGEIPVCTAPGARYEAWLVDAPGGASFALWLDSRGAPGGGQSLYGMRIHPDGGTNVGVPPAAPPDRALAVSPNPSRAGAEVRFASGVRAEAEVAVFDIAGRRLRTLFSGTLEAGEHVATWDGRDAEGRAARPGVYLVRARLGARALEARLVRVE